eukprot:CAMPEP_0172777400 /NCGR_PEP_ID=MMETSP1074-20121228/201380_1 /TAXON_ID=2916 /ORGANISM="Ceratium fusus, Strain PA161109" /LENGTH=460 /DNA_ID=CAMNT_0013614315 /DNA_START=54 /DNA_END=1433 /DNA_ORIENTATION=-
MMQQQQQQRWALFVALLAWLSVQTVQSNPSVPACLAKQCSAEALALGGDAYTQDLGNCASKNFGPCPAKAWDCLGDATCRSVVSCAPDVVGTCKADIWKMMTDKKERDMVLCLSNCEKHGKVDYWCAARKCGKAAINCLMDKTCLSAASCVPKVLLSCSKAGFECVFGRSEVCRENLQCLGDGIGQCADPAVNMLTDHRIADFISCAGSKCPKVCRENLQCLGDGIGRCADPAVNMLTDSRIADFISCAGSKCPKPARTISSESLLPQNGIFASPRRTPDPKHPAEQLMCIAERCGHSVAKIFDDEDTAELLHCTKVGNLTGLCSSVWKCLANHHCAKAVQCWSKPLTKCATSTWHMLTHQKQRKALAANVACLRGCEAAHQDDFLGASFCVLDKCAKDLLACKEDKTCWTAVQCLPQTAEDCAMNSLDAYVNQPLFEDSVKCLGQGFQSCGRRAVGMVQ